MIKKRIIPTLTYKNNGLVKSKKFENFRQVGNPIQMVKVYNMRSVDELIFLDISDQSQRPNFELIDLIADECFMPLTVGGGVQTLNDISLLLKAGADKICIGTQAVEDKEFIADAVQKFGSQAIVVAIDYKTVNGTPCVVSSCGKKIHSHMEPEIFARELELLGVGEIILTSIDHDGTMEGYDIDVATAVNKSINIPLVINGGAGRYQDMFDACTVAKVSAVAASSLFLFTEHTPREAKLFLKERGINIRL